MAKNKLSEILVMPGSDPLYEKIRLADWPANLGWNSNLNDFLRYLYQRNYVNLDGKFPSEISQKDKFKSCLWELCLAEWLQIQSMEKSVAILPHQDSGPDFSLSVKGVDRSIHIEAVCISPGAEPELNKSRIGTGVYQIPPDAMQSRITNSFIEKHNQHATRINDQDYYIVAIGLSGIDFANDPLRYDCYMGAFYPMGGLTRDFDRITGQPIGSLYFSHKDGFYKTGKDGEQKPLINNYFLIDDFSHVSAVIIGREDVNFYLTSEFIKQGEFSKVKLCQNLILLHNSRAKNPLPRGLLDVAFEIEYIDDLNIGFREVNGKTGWF